MKKKLFTSLFMAMLFTALFSMSVLAADETQSDNLSPETEASASGNRRTEYLTASTTHDFDDSHSIYIEARVYVDYEWDEGNYGWLNEAHTVGVDEEHCSYVGSNTISILDPPTLIHCGKDTENQYHEKYYFYGTKVHGLDFYEYTGYIYVYVSVDEWGEVDVWINFIESDYK